MQKKFFYLLVAFLLAVFVFSVTGCGGSSNNLGNNGSKSVEQTLSDSLDGSDMAGVMHGNEWDKLIDEFTKSGSFDKMKPHTLVYCVTDEEAQKLRREYADDEEGLALLESLLFSEDKIASDYEKEHDILLIYPDADFINKALDAVGLEYDFFMDSNASGDKRLEMFAFAKRTVNDRLFIFDYQALMANDAEISSVRTEDDDEDDEVTSDDNASYVTVTETDEEDNNDDNDDGESDIFFNIERWRSYYEWCASLTDMAEESEAEASSIEASADDAKELVKISEAQTRTLDFPHYEAKFRPWKGDIEGDEATINRKNQITIRIYNCHSYKYGNDFYLVKANTLTTPQNYQDKMGHKFGWKQGGGEFGRYGYSDYVNYIYGYTGLFGFDSYISSVVNSQDNSNLSTKEVSLVDNVPPNVPRQKTISKGINWSLGGEVGVNKDGPSAKITGGITHSSNETWTTSEWEIIASPLSVTNSSVKWSADVQGPSAGDWHSADGSTYEGMNPSKAATQALNFNSEWIWQVDKSLWSKQDKNTILMKVHYFWEEGFCYGRGGDAGKYFFGYKWKGGRRYPRFNKYDTMDMVMPKHAWVSQKIFNFDGIEIKTAGFNILSEGEWEVEAFELVNGIRTGSADWVTFTRTSGNATGENEFPVRFAVAANDTGEAREGEIIFTAYVGDKIKEETVIHLNQAAK